MRLLRISSDSHGFWFGLVAGCAVLGLLACTRGEGDPCQVTEDCDDGLVCEGGEGAPRGVCIKRGEPRPMSDTMSDADVDLRPDSIENDSGTEAAGSGG